MDSSSKVKFTTVVNKYPTYRDSIVKGCWRWLEGRCMDDNAEGLWRVHDKIYDLNGFIDFHPGGSEWLKLTKGTDITEAFESYHILPKASLVLKKFYVKDADAPRNYKITYNDDGFYRVLKRRVAEKLPSLDKSDLWKSKLCLDVLVLCFLISSIFAARTHLTVGKILFTIFAGVSGGLLNAASHNFNHQRDNWRMYTANFVLTGWRNWRVFHGLSHHLYPNTFTDLEITAFEPYFRWIPIQKRHPADIYFTYLVSPIVYSTMFHFTFISRVLGMIKYKTFYIDELLTFLPPTLIYLLSDCSIKQTIVLWLIITIIASFCYSAIAINAGHHGYAIAHEGDEIKGLDFAIFQMGATIDRFEADANIVMSLTHFGNHTLHHLFPSLDHALLPQLRPILLETCKEFDAELRRWTLLHATLEQFYQLSRKKPNTVEERTNNYQKYKESLRRQKTVDELK